MHNPNRHKGANYLKEVASMKKLVTLISFAAITAGAICAFAGMAPQTGTNESFHDINVAAGAQPDALGRVCIFCHTPHNAMNTSGLPDPAPLWNHDLGDTASSSGWISYQWAGSGNAGLAAIGDPLMGPTRLCLSCHDGSVNFDQHGPAASPYAQAGSVAFTPASPRYIGGGKDLSTTHPVGFSYLDAETARNAGGANELAANTLTFATAINPAVTYTDPAKITRGYSTTIKSVLYQGEFMTCATCHDVHNKNNALMTGPALAAGVNFFVYADENKSLLCLSCHNK